jgi:electron transfer flavoprotein beta subunit
MKALVAVKRVVDYNVKIRVKPDGSGIELANVKMSMNPFDEIAVEEAVRLKEKGTATEVVSRFGPRAHRPLRKRLRTAHATRRRPRHPRSRPARTRSYEPLAVAKTSQIRIVRRKRQPQLVILGKQAIDDDCNQTGQMLAALARLRRRAPSPPRSSPAEGWRLR